MPARDVARSPVFDPCGLRRAAALVPGADVASAFCRGFTILFTCAAR